MSHPLNLHRNTCCCGFFLKFYEKRGIIYLFRAHSKSVLRLHGMEQGRVRFPVGPLVESLYVTLIDQIERTPNGFAVFDFDNTCIINDITEAVLYYLSANNLFKDENLLSFKSENYAKDVFENYYKLLDENKTREAYEFICKILSKFSVSEINELVIKVLKFEGENITKQNIWDREVPRGIKPREKVIELMEFLKNNEIDVWIVSSSPSILIYPVIQQFNIEANIIGTNNVVKNGVITNELEGPLPIIEGKVECIKDLISNEPPIFGIGDSINDLPMLEYCDIKAVVDRQNDLTKKAEQEKWFII